MRRPGVLAAVGVCSVLLCGCNLQQLTAAEVLSLDSTAGLKDTGNITVAGRWDLSYGWDCSREQSQGTAGADRFAVTVYNSDDDSLAAEHPQVTVIKGKGSGTLHFQRGGTYYAHVDSVCDWRLSVEDLGS